MTHTPSPPVRAQDGNAAAGDTGRGRPHRLQGTDTVQAVAQAFALLEAIADCPGTATAARLAEAAGIPRPRAAHLLSTLSGAGCVYRSARSGYLLGAPLTRIGDAAGKQVGAAAGDQLRELAEQLDETVSIAVLSGDAIFYALQRAPAHRCLHMSAAGQTVHPHASAAGKAILSRLRPAAAHGIAARAGMPALTRATATGARRLDRELAATRRRGYAVDDQEQETGLKCYAVAVPHPAAHAAISVSGPPRRLDADFAARAIPLLRAAADRIAHGIAEAA